MRKTLLTFQFQKITNSETLFCQGQHTGIFTSSPASNSSKKFEDLELPSEVLEAIANNFTEDESVITFNWNDIAIWRLLDRSFIMIDQKPLPSWLQTVQPNNDMENNILRFKLSVIKLITQQPRIDEDQIYGEVYGTKCTDEQSCAATSVISSIFHQTFFTNISSTFAAWEVPLIADVWVTYEIHKDPKKRRLSKLSSGKYHFLFGGKLTTLN